MVASSNQQETVMNQATTHKDSLDACLTLQDHELDSVSGGTPAQDQAELTRFTEMMKLQKQMLQELP